MPPGKKIEKNEFLSTSRRGRKGRKETQRKPRGVPQIYRNAEENQKERVKYTGPQEYLLKNKGKPEETEEMLNYTWHPEEPRENVKYPFKYTGHSGETPKKSSNMQNT